jgi:carboxyl-terminal processing protease
MILTLVRTCVLVGGVLLVSGCATERAEPQLTDAERALNVESFDLVWSTVRDRHWDPDLNGVDWEAARSELRPQVAAAPTRAASRSHFEALLGLLQQSHLEIIPVDGYADTATPSTLGVSGDTGIGVRILEGRAVVTEVRHGSPAEDAGVRAGWIVTRIDDTRIDERLAELAEMWRGHTGVRLVQSDDVLARLLGPVDATIAIEFLDEQDRVVAMTLHLAEQTGFATTMGDLPTTYVTFETRRHDGRFGYIRLGTFAAPNDVMPRLAEAMQDFMEADGIVLDLRGNHGGLAPMAVGCASWFISESGQQLGTMYTRTNEMKIVVYPRPEVYRGPLIVLVDGLSASTAEFLAGGLQGLGRACVFGTTSAGAALPAMIERLPNGDGFIYSVADYISADGSRLEGRGVVPDVVVDHTREDLLNGEDAPLKAALDWLANQYDEGDRVCVSSN